jgi:hypothetical protein
MRKFTSSLFLVAIAMICVSTANASSTSSVSGTVIDAANNMPVAGAHITLFEGSKNVMITTTKTNASGMFSISRLAPGPIRLVVEKAGYASVLASGIELTPSTHFILAGAFALTRDPSVGDDGTVYARNQCRSLVQADQTADAYVVCSGP